MTHGEIWWADLGFPLGSEPGYKRPVIVIQDDSFNKSRIRTVIVVSVTTNIDLAELPGNVFLSSQDSDLDKDGVINVSQISTIDKEQLTDKAGKLPYDIIKELNKGLKLVLNLK